MWKNIRNALNPRVLLFGGVTLVILSTLLTVMVIWLAKSPQPTDSNEAFNQATGASDTSFSTPTIYDDPNDPEFVNTDLHQATLELIETQPSALIDVERQATFDAISVFLDGEQVKIDARPFSYETRVYLPLRQVGESLNTKIGWNIEHRTAIVETATLRLELPVGYRKAIRFQKHNNEQAEVLNIDLSSTKVGTILYNGITYLPIRFTAESLGYSVKFDDGNAKVLFTSPQ